MKATRKIVLACLLVLFVSHSASYGQKFVKDSPPETVKVIVENNKGEVRIVFKWNGDKPATTPANLTCKITDAAGSFNTIPAKDMSFVWEDAPASTEPCKLTVTPTPGTILTGRLKVGTDAFNDLSVPYTGYLVFSSEPSAMAPDTLKFELHKAPTSNIPLNLDNSTLTLPGTNFLPSFVNPLIPGLLYLVLGLLYLLRKKNSNNDNKRLLIIAVVLIGLVGLLITLLRNPGPQYSSVYIDSLQLTEGRNDQTTFPARKYIGILTSEKSGHGKIYLEKKNGDYYLTFRNLPRSGEYNGKIAANVLSPTVVSVKIKVADWALYFFATVLGGILFANAVTPPIRSLEVNKVLVVAGSVLALLVTHFTLYTDTWGTLLDYVKAFAAGASIPLAAKPVFALMHHAAQRWWSKRT